jgi:hypothetical protein
MRARTIILSIVAVVFLLVANFSIWLNTNIFNRQNFTATTVAVIQTPAVRSALSQETIDQIFKNIPVVKQVAGDTLSSAISGLLGSTAAKPVLQGVANEVNVLITSPNPQGVSIDISSFRGLIKPVASALNKNVGSSIVSTKVPKEIVLLQKGDIPSIYSWGVVLLWLGPILGLIGLGILVGLIWTAGESARSYVLKATGFTLAVGSLVFMFLVGILKAPMLASIVSANVRIVADNIFDAFAGKLIGQSWVVFFAGVILAVAGYYLPRVRKTQTAQKIRNLRIAS